MEPDYCPAPVNQWPPGPPGSYSTVRYIKISPI